MFNEFDQLLIRLLLSASFLIIPLLCFHLIQKVFLASIERSPNRLMKFYGVLSVPVHEVSHLIACIVFRHKVDKVVLLDFKATNGALGYVQHRYSPTSLWQVVGTFFIGIAPIFGGILATVLSTQLLLSNGEQWLAELMTLDVLYTSEGSLFDQILQVFMVCTRINFNYLMASFSDNVIFTGVWAIFVASIGLYLTPSVEDLKGSLKGFIVIAAVLFSIQLLLHDNINFEYIESVAIVLSSILSLALTASTILLLATRLLFGFHSIISTLSRKLREL